MPDSGATCSWGHDLAWAKLSLRGSEQLRHIWHYIVLCYVFSANNAYGRYFRTLNMSMLFINIILYCRISAYRGFYCILRPLYSTFVITSFQQFCWVMCIKWVTFIWNVFTESWGDVWQWTIQIQSGHES